MPMIAMSLMIMLHDYAEAVGYGDDGDGEYVDNDGDGDGGGDDGYVDDGTVAAVAAAGEDTTDGDYDIDYGAGIC